MQLALRPYATAGVALAGAGLISVTPVVAPDIEQQIEQRAVALVGAPYDLVGPAGLLFNTADNLAGLAKVFVANPFPIARAVLENQVNYSVNFVNTLGTVAGNIQQLVAELPSTLQSAWSDIMAGNFYQGIFTLQEYFFLGAPALSLLPVFTDFVFPTMQSITGNLNAVSQSAELWGLQLLLGPIYPLIAGSVTFGAVGQNIVDDMSSGNVEGVLQNLLLGPTTILNGILNGNAEQGAALLTNTLGTISPQHFGSIQNIFSAQETIANLIAPTSSATLNHAMATLGAAFNVPDLTAGLNLADLGAAINPADLAAMFGPALTALSDLPGTLMSLVP